MSYRTGSLLPRWQWNAIADTAVLLAVWAAVLVMSDITDPVYRSVSTSWALVLIAVGSTVAGFWIRSLYETPRLARTDEISRIISTTTVGAGLTAVAASFADVDLGARELLLGTPLSISLLILGRGVVSHLKGPSGNQRIVIVGTGGEAKELVHLLRDHPESALSVVGVIGNAGVAREQGLSTLWLGPAGRLIEIMKRTGATGAIITPTGFRNPQFRHITQALFDEGYDIHLSTGVTHIYAGRFEVRPVVHEPLVRLTNHRPFPFEAYLKRALDLVGASIILLAASPVMLLTALAIKVEDRGPVLFRQVRKSVAWTTEDGDVVVDNFEMLKFRSMVTDAEEIRNDLAEQNERTGPIFKISTDPRITRVGRFIREVSIDELPQLFNVLRGDMSLVGPRPALLAEEPSFDEQHRRRFVVKPGITGLWQVEARSNREFRAYRRLDLHYVENWSLSLDLRILLATVAYVVVELILFPFRRLLPSSVDGVVDPSDAGPTAEETGPTINLDPVKAASGRSAPSIELIDPIQAESSTRSPWRTSTPAGSLASGRSRVPSGMVQES